MCKVKVEGVASREAWWRWVVLLLGSLVEHKQLLLEVEVVRGEEVRSRISPWHGVGVSRWIASPWECACFRPCRFGFCLTCNILRLSLGGKGHFTQICLPLSGDSNAHRDCISTTALLKSLLHPTWSLVRLWAPRRSDDTGDVERKLWLWDRQWGGAGARVGGESCPAALELPRGGGREGGGCQGGEGRLVPRAGGRGGQGAGLGGGHPRDEHLHRSAVTRGRVGSWLLVCQPCTSLPPPDIEMI